MCQYCKIGVSVLSTNIVKMAIDHTMNNEDNAWVECLNTRGEKIKVPFKINYCPICGREL